MKLKIRKLDNMPYWKLYDKHTGHVYAIHPSKEYIKAELRFLKTV